MLPGEVLCDSDIELGNESHSYSTEKTKIECLENICSRFGRTLRVFSLSEFYKSGAMLSCLIMHVRQPVEGNKNRSIGTWIEPKLTTREEFHNQS